MLNTSQIGHYAAIAGHIYFKPEEGLHFDLNIEGCVHVRPDLQLVKSTRLLCLQGNCAELDPKSAQHCSPPEVGRSIRKVQQQYKDIANASEKLNHNFTVIKNMNLVF